MRLYRVTNTPQSKRFSHPALLLALVAGTKFPPCEIHHRSLHPGSLVIKPEIRGLNKAWAVPAREAQVSLYTGAWGDKGSPLAPYHTRGGVIPTQTWKVTPCIQWRTPNPPSPNPQSQQPGQNEEAQTPLDLIKLKILSQMGTLKELRSKQ